MSRSQEEAQTREWATELGYRLIKNSRTGRYSLIKEDGDFDSRGKSKTGWPISTTPEMGRSRQAHRRLRLRLWSRHQ